MTVIRVGNSTSASGGPDTSIGVWIPGIFPGLAAGDLAYAFGMCDAGVNVTTPSGWIARRNQNFGVYRYMLWSKTVTSSETFQGFLIASGSTNISRLTIVVYRAPNGEADFGATFQTQSPNALAPSVTPDSSASKLVIIVAGGFGTGGNWQFEPTPAGLAEVTRGSSAGVGVALGVYDQTVGVGPTGNRTILGEKADASQPPVPDASSVGYAILLRDTAPPAVPGDKETPLRHFQRNDGLGVAPRQVNRSSRQRSARRSPNTYR